MRTMTNKAATVALVPTLFTVQEAAWAVDTPETFIHKEIDRKILTAQNQGDRTRLLDRSALGYLRAVREFRNFIQVELRKRIHREVRQSIQRGQLDRVAFDAFVLQLDAVLEEIDRRIENIIEARSSVDSDARIRGGAPVIIGTRIPVHIIGEMVRNGAIVSDLAEQYDLTNRQVELAVLYDKLHPRRGRPANGFGNNFNDMGENVRSEIEELGEYQDRDIPIAG